MAECTPTGACDGCLTSQASGTIASRICSDHSDCVFLFGDCIVCNGTCRIGLTSRLPDLPGAPNFTDAHLSFFEDTDRVDAGLTACNQWSHVENCWGDAGAVAGGWRKILDLPTGHIPDYRTPVPDHRDADASPDWSQLGADPLWLASVDAVQTPEPWRYRDDAHQRARLAAMALCAYATGDPTRSSPAGTSISNEQFTRGVWLLLKGVLAEFGNPMELDPTDMGYADDELSQEEIDELNEVQEATCSHPRFEDCDFTPPRTVSVGELKTIFR